MTPYKTIIPILLFFLIASSCKKFIDVGAPPNAVTNPYVFSNEATATSAILAIYSRMSEGTGIVSGGSNGLGYYGGLLSDELINYSNSSGLTEMYTNSLLETTGNVSTIWRQIYRHIYDANASIEGISSSSSLGAPLKKQLLAEAYFIRAYCYFTLTNLFGEVPLILSTDYKLSLSIERSKPQDIYTQIVKDLETAKDGLSDNYLSAANKQTPERVRPNRFAASAMLARVFLYIKDYPKAEKLATEVIDNRSLYDTVAVDQVFLKNSREAIWQLMPVVAGKNTFDASAFVLLTAPSPASISEKNTSLSNSLISSFEPGDKRENSWIGSITVSGTTYKYAYKYKSHLSNQPVTEYAMVFRLAEQYLIRAEAKIQQNKVADGISDLNVLRKRARSAASAQVPNPLPDISATLSVPDALLAVEKERRTELFTENGHRWFDLIRLGRATAVLQPIKGTNWQGTDVLWPIPQSEMLLNTNLKPQNPGY